MSEDQPGYVAPPPPIRTRLRPLRRRPGRRCWRGRWRRCAWRSGRRWLRRRTGRGGRGGPPQVPSMTVVVRGKISKTNEWTDNQVIFHVANDLYTTSGAHYGSRLLFDKQNHLFFTMGERNGNNPNYAQDLTKPLGKVLRMNDDGTVPKDNPFVNTPGADARIWTYGHRNPEGLAWDPVTGALWESEHGPNTADEINVLVAGHNYGWNLVSKQGPPQYKLSAPDMDDPIVYFTPTFAPSGISFYTGDKYPGWKNTSLFVSGLAGQALRRLEVKGNDRRPSGSGVRQPRTRTRHQAGAGRAVLRAGAESDRRAEPGRDGNIAALRVHAGPRRAAVPGCRRASGRQRNDQDANVGTRRHRALTIAAALLLAASFTVSRLPDAGAADSRAQSARDRRSDARDNGPAPTAPGVPVINTTPPPPVYSKMPGNMWPPAGRRGKTSPALTPRRGAEDVLAAARLSRRARRGRADDRVADRDGLRSRRPAVGARDARVPAGHVRPRLARADQPRRRARRHERRRQDGQAHGVRRRPRPARARSRCSTTACSSASRRTCG